jgi:phosphoglucosamine mutase
MDADAGDLFGTSGIRGRVGEDVTAGLALRVGRAVGREARDRSGTDGGGAGRPRVVGGVAVTASHNPPTDNGLKLWTAAGQAFDADARERHARAAAGAVAVAEPLRVAVDVGNGAGGVTVDALSRLGCAVETLNARPDGSFLAGASADAGDRVAVPVDTSLAVEDYLAEARTLVEDALDGDG